MNTRDSLARVFGDVEFKKLPVSQHLRPKLDGQLTGYRAYPYGQPNGATRCSVEVIIVMKPQPKARLTVYDNFHGVQEVSFIVNPMRPKTFNKMKKLDKYSLPNWYYFVAFILGFFWTHRNENEK